MFSKILYSLVAVLFFILSIGSFGAHATNTDLGSDEFELDVSIFTPGGEKIIGGGSLTAVTDTNFALGFIIQQLMLFIGGIALLVMTIGAGYIIVHHGDDATLSKGKEIFTAGIIGLSVALLSYYMISLLRYLIYSI